MKKYIICTLFVCIANMLFAQTYTFETFTEKGISYNFTINTKTKKIKEVVAGLANIDLPYYNYYSTSEWIAFGLEKGSKIPHTIKDFNTCDDYIVFNLTTGVNMKLGGTEYLFAPKEMITDKHNEYIQRLKNLNKVLGGKVVTRSSNAQNSVTPKNVSTVNEKDIELPLKVDGYSGTHTFTLTGKGDDKVFPIRTKSGKYISETSFKEYEAWTDASWGEIKYKTESAILMRYDDNTTGSTRTANVYVKAGDVTTQMIVSQPPLRAIVNKVWIEHNKWSGLTKGMKIHVDFTTYGVIGMQGECVAYFNFSNGQKIMDYNGLYRTTDGQACCVDRFVPPYESSNYNDFVLFMPYTELHLSGHADCKCNVEVHIGGERAYGESVGFTFN